jgi:hypothetical protein
MLTRIYVENFKKLRSIDLELGRNVVFVGPNNSGKTSALQAFALWYVGLTQWLDGKAAGATARKRTGVTINRNDLFALPIPHTNLLWKDLHVRSGRRNKEKKTVTENILIKVTCDGVLNDKPWSIELHFDYSSSEALFCRPAHTPLTDEYVRLMKSVATQTRVAFLPPMSGLASEEPLLTPGRVNVLIGQGRTAEVLRNLCYSVAGAEDVVSNEWIDIAKNIEKLFGVKLDRPKFDSARGDLRLTYKSAAPNKVELDISSAGRGLQQTLLLLTYLSAYRGATILLDEPDAHLEVLRQRQIYDVITTYAASSGSQIVAATHSEVVLNEAAGRDTVIAFLGQPHRINDQGAQLKKSLLSIGFEHYMKAETTKWVLYLEGSTDAALRLDHPVAGALSSAYVDYLDTNQPPLARERFHALREAVPSLRGIALFDRLDRSKPSDDFLDIHMWRRREIENYICTESALLAWAAADGSTRQLNDLVEQALAPARIEAMQEAISRVVSSLEALGKPSPWEGDLKVSEEFLEPLFARYNSTLGLPESIMRKKRFYELADFVPLTELDSEVREKLDAIHAIATAAGNN